MAFHVHGRGGGTQQGGRLGGSPGRRRVLRRAEKGQSRSTWEGEGSASMDGSSSVSGGVTPFPEAGGSEDCVLTQETSTRDAAGTSLG